VHADETKGVGAISPSTLAAIAPAKPQQQPRTKIEEFTETKSCVYIAKGISAEPMPHYGFGQHQNGLGLWVPPNERACAGDPDARSMTNPKLRVHNNTYLTRHTAPFRSPNAGRFCQKDAEDVYPAIRSRFVEEQECRPWRRFAA
jgi:hypothetical protein